MSVLDRIFRDRTQQDLQQWEQRASHLADLKPEALRDLRNHARKLSRVLARVMSGADRRLAVAEGKTGTVRRHPNADWSYRPEVWTTLIQPRGHVSVKRGTRLGHELAVFHDCTLEELTLQQIRNSRKEVIATFGLQMDVFEFGGTFLSFALDLPGSVLDGLSSRHIVSVEADLEMEHPIEIFVRLNIQHGPNTEQVVRQIKEVEDTAAAEFDLGYTDLSGKKADKVWLDFIFEGPSMNQITIFDLALTRRPRASL